MPWNDQSGGNNNGGGRGPWGQGPSGGGGGGGGGGQGPDLEELLKRGQDRFRRAARGGGGGGFGGLGAGGLILAALVAFGLWMTTTFYTVQPGEVGVVLRFGEHVRSDGPGLSFHFPTPIDRHQTLNVAEVRETNIGFVRGSGTSRQAILQESLMLTGDQNIIDMQFTVFWVIDDAANYLFNVQYIDGTVKDVAQSAMREIIGQSNLSTALLDRPLVSQGVQEITQAVLTEYGAGIRVTQIAIQDSQPPAQVVDAFRDVEAARQNRDQAQNLAEAYANRILPEARGEAERISQEAQAYREQTVAEATGEATRFGLVLEQYLAAPEITRQRLYLESMEHVLGNTDLIVIDETAGDSVLPYLPLPALERSTGSTSNQGTGR